MNTKPIYIHKNRTNLVMVSLGIDVSQDTITSQIRAERDVTSDLLATWTVSFITDGTDGELLLTLDDAITWPAKSNGFMDLKRVSGGEPISVFQEPIPVAFVGVVTG